MGEALALLLTQVADNSRGLPQPGTDFQSLPNVVCALPLLPTPRASAGMNGNLRPEANDTSRLEDAVAVNLLPTPRATDGTKGGPNQRGSSGDLMLPSAVHLLPTPACNDMGEGLSLIHI